jgi:hypothetical protein
MACKKPLFSLLAGIALWGCYAPPSSDEAFNESIVVTSHAEGADFSTYGTFFVRPEIRILDEGREEDDPAAPEEVAPAVAAPLVDTTVANLTARGYTQAATAAEANLSVELVYLRSVNSQQYCYAYYGWYDYYYWGYPYYPYYPYCDTSVWRSGTLLSYAMDTAIVAPPPVGDGGLGPDIPTDKVLRTVWTSAIYGAEVTSVNYVQDRAVAGINQAFIQSPYFTATP